MKTLMKEDSSDADSNSFLLDDNSSIPFSVDDISRSLQHTDFTRVQEIVDIDPANALMYIQFPDLHPHRCPKCRIA
ncbi:Myosin-6 [Sesamum angolense]|uniref:Myosin-6 n=1 Tax=Sesamum angolense TaxID=2727404 RepID=A0AAE1W7B8_9LAMI|nr:Myosin-6 [Sesamum angolense]